MSRLQLKSFGVDCEGIELKGDPKRPEPDHARIVFPGGDVDVVRTSDGQYWVHVRVNHKDGSSYDPFNRSGELCDGRIDLVSGYPTKEQLDALEDPSIYHLAVRVSAAASPAN